MYFKESLIFSYPTTRIISRKNKQFYHWQYCSTFFLNSQNISPIAIMVKQIVSFHSGSFLPCWPSKLALKEFKVDNTVSNCDFNCSTFLHNSSPYTFIFIRISYISSLICLLCSFRALSMLCLSWWVRSLCVDLLWLWTQIVKEGLDNGINRKERLRDR